METVAVAPQLNTSHVDYTYRMPVEFFGKFDNETGKRLTSRIGTAGLIKWLADTFTFSVFKDGKTGICTRTNEQFTRDLNVSESTVYRARNKFVGKYVKNEKKGKYQFDIENNPLSGGYYALEAWMTRPILHNGKTIEFTNVTQLVAAYFNSECNRKPQELSTRELAYKLDISELSAQRAINVLTADYKNNPFVYRTEKGVNGHKRSVYVINRALFRKLNKAEEKRLKAQIKAREKSKAEPDAETNKAVESELNERRQYRIERAESVYARALADEEFRVSGEALKRLAPKLAFAELKHLPGLTKLQQEECELTGRRKAALKRLEIDEAEFSEEFHCKCIKCHDKLFLANGKPCGCFSRGAPT